MNEGDALQQELDAERRAHAHYWRVAEKWKERAEALAARLEKATADALRAAADEWTAGEWARAYADHGIKTLHQMDSAQAAADWLRTRADRIAEGSSK